MHPDEKGNCRMQGRGGQNKPKRSLLVSDANPKPEIIVLFYWVAVQCGGFKNKQD